MRRKRTVIVGGSVILAVVLIAATVVAIRLRDGTVKHRVTQALSEHLKSDVTINTLSVRLFPTVRVIGSGLVIRRKSDPPERPPMITADRFVVKPGLWHLLTGRAREVEMEGLRFTIPKRPQGRARLVDDATDTAPAVQAQRSGRRPVERATLKRLVAKDAELIYVSSRPGGPVRVFKVPSVELTEVSFDAPVEFKAVLINPLPHGRLDTSGLFGPFDSSDPGNSTVEGGYAFSDGDFNSIRGLSGVVTSSGLFSGQLDQMTVNGTTSTDNFQLDASTHALPLHTEFRAIVDGTDGDIRLTHVQARLARSAFTATGTITGTPGVRGRRIALDVEVPAGRVEDFLKLALPASRPVMAGDVTLVTSFVLPPGDTPALSRMELNGKIGLSDAHFSSRATAAKIAELSRRGRGKSADAPPERALMGLSGEFKYARGVARFSSLRFHTPGAAIALSGSYTLHSGAMNFGGTVSFDAKVSKVVGGVKGFLLKVVDPLFRDNGQKGSTVPITIGGTHDAPRTSVNFGRVFGG